MRVLSDRIEAEVGGWLTVEVDSSGHCHIGDKESESWIGLPREQTKQLVKVLTAGLLLTEEASK